MAFKRILSFTIVSLFMLTGFAVVVEESSYSDADTSYGDGAFVEVSNVSQTEFEKNVMDQKNYPTILGLANTVPFLNDRCFDTSYVDIDVVYNKISISRSIYSEGSYKHDKSGSLKNDDAWTVDVKNLCVVITFKKVPSPICSDIFINDYYGLISSYLYDSQFEIGTKIIMNFEDYHYAEFNEEIKKYVGINSSDYLAVEYEKKTVINQNFWMNFIIHSKSADTEFEVKSDVDTFLDSIDEIKYPNLYSVGSQSIHEYSTDYDSTKNSYKIFEGNRNICEIDMTLTNVYSGCIVPPDGYSSVRTIQSSDYISNISTYVNYKYNDVFDKLDENEQEASNYVENSLCGTCRDINSSYDSSFNNYYLSIKERDAYNEMEDTATECCIAVVIAAAIFIVVLAVRIMK